MRRHLAEIENRLAAHLEPGKLLLPLIASAGEEHRLHGVVRAGAFVALGELKKGAGTQFDPKVVETFMRLEKSEWSREPASR